MERADGIPFMERHTKSLVTSGLLLALLESAAQQCCILNCDSSFPPKNTEHPWLKNADKASNVSIGEVVRSNLKQFSSMNKFKKKALGVSCR